MTERRPAVVVGVAAATLIALVTLDVLADGPLRRWDAGLMLGPGGLRLTDGGWFWLWRTIVWGGQFWLVGSLTAITAGIQAFRLRRAGLLVAVGLWIVADQGAAWAFKQVIGRTYPRSGADHLFTSIADPAYPSGHATLGTSCLLVIAAMVTGRPAGYATPIACCIAAATAVATVMLGYHWPTDAIAGFGFGVILGLAGRSLVRRWIPAPRLLETQI